MSYFITFEGIECSGKSTIINYLKYELEAMGYRVVVTREPGGSRISEQIREILLDFENSSMSYKTEALLYAASREQHLKDVIIPNLSYNNTIILCDRFVDSSLVYQGIARNLGFEYIKNINSNAFFYMPNITFFLDVTLETSKIRLEQRDITDRLEKEGDLFFNKVRDGYLKVSNMYKDRIIKIDANLSIDIVKENILSIIKERLCGI